VKDARCPDVLGAAYKLAKRQEFGFLLSQYPVAGQNTREWIVQAIYASDLGRKNQKVVRFMTDIGFSGPSSDKLSDTRWYALQFLADTCNESALSEMSAHGGDVQAPYQFQVACSDWARSLRAFGLCRYVAAREVLLDSLNSSCLDVLQAAGTSLQTLYPDAACSKKKTFAEIKGCYYQSWNK
jgi:hypothetical protein